MPLRRNLWVPQRRPSVAAGSWLWIGRFSGTVVASGNFTFDLVTDWVAGPGAEAAPGEGDLVVAGISYRDTAAFTLPADWNLVATQQSSGNTSTTSSTAIGSGVLAWTTWTAGRSLVFTRTAGDVAGGLGCVYRGQEASPYDTGSAQTQPSNSSTPTIPATLTTAEGNELLVYFAALSRNTTVETIDAATAPSVASSGGNLVNHPILDTWLRRGNTGTVTGADAGWGIADAIKDTAGATGTFGFTAGVSSRHVGIVGAFKRLN